MGDYRRMGSVEQHLGHATSTTLLHQLRDLWRSPRGTVLRIKVLALVAIVLSFFLAAFGSCRRWSNRWIVQKGFLAVQVLSLSFGTYSIGLMQSSPVKSEMYPIWAVSLLTLFGCVDPVTTYIGLDYKGPLLKVIFQVCLYCGYVLLMSVMTISGVVGNLAIGVLSAITFFKVFHRSLALVLPSRTRNQPAHALCNEPSTFAGVGEQLVINNTFMLSINTALDKSVSLGLTTNDKTMIKDVCLGYSLSCLLQQRFLGLDTASNMEERRKEFEGLVQDGRIQRGGSPCPHGSHGGSPKPPRMKWRKKKRREERRKRRKRRRKKMRPPNPWALNPPVKPSTIRGP